MATVVIGDIHGNYRALDDLLSKVQAGLQAEDTVVFLGDYIDRGPDSKSCVNRILEFHATVSATVVTLLGNHEDWLLRTLADPTRHSWVLGMEAFHTIASYSRSAAVELRSALEAAGPRLLTERVALPYDLFFSTFTPAVSAELGCSLCSWRSRSDHTRSRAAAAGCVSLGYRRLPAELSWPRPRRLRPLGGCAGQLRGLARTPHRGPHYRHRHHCSRRSHSHPFAWA